MYFGDVPLHAASGLFMFTLPPKRGTIRKQKLIKKAESIKLNMRRRQSLNGDESGGSCLTEWVSEGGAWRYRL